MRLFLVILLCLFAVGCRTNPRVNRQTALLRAEILDLEDKYYSLKSKYDGVIGQLGETGVGQTYYDGDVIYEGEVIHDNFAPVEANRYDESGTGPTGSIITAPNGDSTNDGTRSGETMESQRPPTEMAPVENSGQLTEPKTDAGQSNLLLNAPGIPSSSDIEVSFPRVINGKAEITEIQINQKTTRGRNVDNEAGDDGIDVMIQPITADGQVEFQAGELTISVQDKTQPADRQRIGLWKFLPEETKLFFANDESGNRGILLHLPWDQFTPVNETLDLDVRFITNDGRTLQTSGTLRIKPPAPGYSSKSPDVARWTRQDARWIPEPAPQMMTDDGSGWREKPEASSSRQTAGGRARRAARPARRLIPEKAEIKRPAWRPIR